MKEKIEKILKRLILGVFIIYTFNMISVSYSILIPLNIFTVVLVGFLGLPALAALFFLSIMIF